MSKTAEQIAWEHGSDSDPASWEYQVSVAKAAIAEGERRGREEERVAVMAWIQDRREKYRPDSGYQAMFDEQLGGLSAGEHILAVEHGELDDLLEHERKRLYRDDPRYAPIAAAGKERK